MAQFITNGGCYNAMRWANDGAGQGNARDWIAPAEQDINGIPNSVTLILATAWDSDDMNSIDGDFELRWRNLTDAGSMAVVVSGSGEIRLGTGTDLINGNAVISVERLGVEDCTGMGVDHLDGTEREGANAIDLTGIPSDSVFDNQWAIDFTNAVANKEYEFDVVETGTSNVYATLAGSANIVAAGKIDGQTFDEFRDGGDLVSQNVTVYLSDGGSPPKPVGDSVAQLVSSAVDGTYSAQEGIASGNKYFIITGDATHSDATIEATAVDR